MLVFHMWVEVSFHFEFLGTNRARIFVVRSVFDDYVIGAVFLEAKRFTTVGARIATRLRVSDLVVLVTLDMK
jgi:hypothetical protein